jgi:hypothetical protein
MRSLRRIPFTVRFGIENAVLQPQICDKVERRVLQDQGHEFIDSTSDLLDYLGPRFPKTLLK